VSESARERSEGSHARPLLTNIGPHGGPGINGNNNPTLELEGKRRSSLGELDLLRVVSSISAPKIGATKFRGLRMEGRVGVRVSPHGAGRVTAPLPFASAGAGPLTSSTFGSWKEVGSSPADALKMSGAMGDEEDLLAQELPPTFLLEPKSRMSFPTASTMFP
jgi:hypothetical protein